MILRTVAFVASVLALFGLFVTSGVGSGAGAALLPSSWIGSTADNTGRGGSTAAVEAVSSKAPLDPYPYLVASIEAQEAGDTARANALLEQAVRLRPRLAEARLWRMRHYATAGRADAAVAEANVLYRLRPRLGPQLSGFLAEMSADAAARDIVARRLANSPFLLQVLRDSSKAELPAPALLELMRYTNLHELRGGLVAAQSAVTSSLISEGRYREAHRTWHQLLGRPAGSNPVFDPHFAVVEAAAPFNWTLGSGTDVDASSVASGLPRPATALRIRAYGDLPSSIASQSLVLDPGTYSLSFQARGDGTGAGDGAPFQWTLRCNRGPILLELPVQPPAMEWTLHSERFEVPADCPLAILEMKSTGRYPRGTPELLITAVEISRL